jgi:hypothetical protein
MSMDALTQKSLGTQAVLICGMYKAPGKNNSSVSKGRLCKCPSAPVLDTKTMKIISGLTISACLYEKDKEMPRVTGLTCFL